MIYVLQGISPQMVFVLRYVEILSKLIINSAMMVMPSQRMDAQLIVKSILTLLANLTQTTPLVVLAFILGKLLLI